MAAQRQTTKYSLKLKDYYCKLWEIYPTLVHDLTSSPSSELQDAPSVNTRLANILDYIFIAKKKLSRGITTAISYSFFEKELSEEKVFLSYIVAWCTELDVDAVRRGYLTMSLCKLEASFEIVDDMMDGSETRRGMKCWYLLENNGLLAYNDAWMIESCVYALLARYFNKKNYYTNLLELFHDATRKCLYGQTLDVTSAIVKQFKTLTQEQHYIATKYKAGYLMNILPIAAAMVMSGTKYPEEFEEVKDICVELGCLFTAQDDYMDVFGNSEEIGNDIAEGKCTWVILTALKLATNEQRQILEENYGRNEACKIEMCKAVFTSVGIPEIYKNYENEMMEKLYSSISHLPRELPREPFWIILEQISEGKFY